MAPLHYLKQHCMGILKYIIILHNIIRGRKSHFLKNNIRECVSSSFYSFTVYMHARCVKLLIKHGAKAGIKDKHQNLPTHLAVVGYPLSFSLFCYQYCYLSWLWARITESLWRSWLTEELASTGGMDAGTVHCTLPSSKDWRKWSNCY